MQPKLIEPKDIRPGDLVRFSITRDGIARSYCATATSHFNEKDGFLMVGGSCIYHETGGSWTLLLRPEPPREPGTLWRDPQTRVIYACIRSDGCFEYVPYPAYVTGPERAHVLVEYDSNDDEIIARLERIDS